MRWLKRLALLLRAYFTALLEWLESPEQVLHQQLVDMEEELEGLRARVAGVLADEVQLGRQLAAARDAADQWERRAARALRRGDEASARSALTEKLEADQRAQSLQDELHKHQEQTSKLRQALRDLEDRIRQARERRSLLLARLARADSARTVRRLLDQAEGQSLSAPFRRLEERVERVEALEQAGETLHADAALDAGAEPEDPDRLDKEYEALKRRVGEADALPVLDSVG